MSEPKLSIFLATPPGFNPGMAATELALRSFLHRHDLEAVARCYRLVPFVDRLQRVVSSERLAEFERRSNTGLTFHSVFQAEDDISASDARLFWADYLHMGSWLREMTPIVAAQLRITAADASRSLARVLLLDDADDAALARSMSFGTTLLFNTLQDERESSYGMALRRLLKQARRVWVRDALSAARVAHLRGDFDTGYFGVDCALLLSRGDVEDNAREHGVRETSNAGCVLVFIGREMHLRAQLMATALELGRTFKRPVRWLQWGDDDAFPQLRSRADTAAATNDATVHELLYDVANAAVVVTDTYHLALCAWNFGVPAVAGFSGDRTVANDVSSGPQFSSRDKREIFYSQYDALDFLIRPEEFLDEGAYRRRMAHITEMLCDRWLCEAIVARVHAHAAALEFALASELRELLFGETKA